MTRGDDRRGYRAWLKRSYPLFALHKMLQAMPAEARDILSLPLWPLPKSKLAHAPFVIFGQTRSGTHLLASLLNSHPDVHCDNELFDRDVPRLYEPEHFVALQCAKHQAQTYGFVLHLRHLLMMKHLEQDTFLTRLHEQGFRVIHLRRANLVRQQISLELGKQRGYWHRFARDAHSDSPITIDPAELVRRVRLRELKAALETELLRDVPHMTLAYEEDLLQPAARSVFLSRAFQHLDLPDFPVESDVTRTGTDDLQEAIANYAEVEKALTDVGYGHFLPADSGSSESVENR